MEFLLIFYSFWLYFLRQFRTAGLSSVLGLLEGGGVMTVVAIFIAFKFVSSVETVVETMLVPKKF